MTFCVALKSRAGLVALADTRIVRGSERLTKGKLALVEDGDGSFFVMMSGLRSVRDKLLIYTEEALSDASPTRLYEVANAFGEQMRRVRAEDADALAASKLSFNAHAIIGGRLADDAEPTLFYLYPEGNWIEAADDSPWFTIGRTHYGRPILDRLMHVEAPLELSLALAVLALDATAASVTDVGYPVDLVTLSAAGGGLREHRFEEAELQGVSAWWHERLADAITDMPMAWAGPLLGTDEPHAPSHAAMGGRRRGPGQDAGTVPDAPADVAAGVPPGTSGGADAAPSSGQAAHTAPRTPPDTDQ